MHLLRTHEYMYSGSDYQRSTKVYLAAIIEIKYYYKSLTFLLFSPWYPSTLSSISSASDGGNSDTNSNNSLASDLWVCDMDVNSWQGWLLGSLSLMMVAFRMRVSRRREHNACRRGGQLGAARSIRIRCVMFRNMDATHRWLGTRNLTVKVLLPVDIYSFLLKY